MAKIPFDRTDKQVIEDALTMTVGQFTSKYVEITTSLPLVLQSVHRNINNRKTIEESIAKNSEEVTDMVEVEEEIIDTPEKLKSFSDRTQKADKPTVKEEAITDGAVKVDKPGRTPAMRELIKIHGKDDKQKIKRLLTEDGFNCEGSGFHSEWHRLTKAK